MATPASPSTRPAGALVRHAPLPLELVAADDPVEDVVVDLKDKEVLVALVRAEFELAPLEVMAVAPSP